MSSEGASISRSIKDAHMEYDRTITEIETRNKKLAKVLVAYDQVKAIIAGITEAIDSNFVLHLRNFKGRTLIKWKAQQ